MFFQRKTQLLGVFGSLLCGGQVVQALNYNPDDVDSIKAAASNAAYNMMTNYHGNETDQLPGLLFKPYYWWEAGAMFGQLIHYWFLTGDTTYNQVTTTAIQFQVGEHQDFMPGNQSKDLGNDDQVFWAYTAMDAAELKFPDPPPDKPSWLGLAQAVFNEQVTRWDMANCNGGLRWQIYIYNTGYDYKNTISNAGLFQLAARLARYTGNQTYADWAEKTYDWMDAVGIISPKFDVWDGVRVANCSQITEVYWSYNVGSLLSGAAYMYNYTNGNATWQARLDGLINGTNVFFVQTLADNPKQVNPPPNGNIMSEVACESPTPQTCDVDQPSFKAYLSRWLAVTTQLAPYTAVKIMPLLRASAIAAAGQCTGTATGQPGIPGTICGRRWYQTVWDGFFGVGEQMSALSVFQSNLISKVAPPVTMNKGGTSVSNPAAGTGPNSGNTDPIMDPTATRIISTGDKAGAGILTALSLVLIIAATWWMVA